MKQQCNTVQNIHEDVAIQVKTSKYRHAAD